MNDKLIKVNLSKIDNFKDHSYKGGYENYCHANRNPKNKDFLK